MTARRVGYRLALSLVPLALVGASLWVTWVTAAYWAPCIGLDRRRIDNACAEAMSTFSQVPVFNLWAVMAALVLFVVTARLVPRLPGGVIAITAVALACPLADPGFFWVQWGSADGIPGQGSWTAIMFALAGIGMLLPTWTNGSSTITNTESLAPSDTDSAGMPSCR
ncbi:hypothetical protein ACO03V_02550 [Microbacterium sp. HMH0099]|uniref:hypothetical protein n=1 Tax=Microbacterium sp. HMH0099 TaxID=3414026 RepID=UPI003BF629B5